MNIINFGSIFGSNLLTILKTAPAPRTLAAAYTFRKFWLRLRQQRPEPAGPETLLSGLKEIMTQTDQLTVQSNQPTDGQRAHGEVKLQKMRNHEQLRSK